MAFLERRRPHIIDFTEGTYQKLFDLAEISGLPRSSYSIVELIQDMARTYDWIIQQQALGRTIVAQEESGEPVVAMDLLIARWRMDKAREYVQKISADQLANH